MQPPPLSHDIALTLGVALGALVLFFWGRFRPDAVGLIVLVTLILTGLVTPEEGISGFSNEAVITVTAMLVLSAGLLRTGVIDLLGRLAGRLGAKSELRTLAAILALAVPLSAFINNTAVVQVLLPVALALSRQAGVPPSRLLMPMSFGSQLGGTLTLIGTSTNLLVAGLLLDLGLKRIRLFDITPPALVVMLAGLVYLFTVGRWLSPKRAGAEELIGTHELREYVSGLIVEAESRVLGRSLAEVRFGDRYGLRVVEIQREGRRIPFPASSIVLREGDLLVVTGKIADIQQVEEDSLRIVRTAADEANSRRSQARLAEMIVPPRSGVVGRQLKQVHVLDVNGVSCLAIQRHGEPLRERIDEVALRPGDVLLVQGPAAGLQRVHQGNALVLLGGVEIPERRRRKMKIVLPIMAMVVLLPAFGITTILVSSLVGVVAMFVTGSIKPEEAWEQVDWMVIVLLGSILPLGLAMRNTGTADFLAQWLLHFIAPYGPFVVLAAIYLLTTLLTELMSNNASAIVVAPIAVATAAALEISPMPLVIAVMLAASNSFMTPIGYQTNLLIYSPGGYRFTDYVRVGGPLGLISLVVATVVIPVFFPF